MIKTSLMFGLLLLCLNTQAQGRWFNFGELDSLRKVEERPVLVFLEAEWCVYCKKMKREAFSKADIQEEIAGAKKTLEALGVKVIIDLVVMIIISYIFNIHIIQEILFYVFIL